MIRSFRSKSRWLAAGLALCGASLSAEEAAPPNLFDTLQKQVQAGMEKARDAIVRVEGTDEHGLLAGTGFFVDPNGLMYATYTVAGKTHDLFVRRGDMKLSAKRLAADPRSGIALLKVETQTAFLQVGKSSELTT